MSKKRRLYGLSLGVGAAVGVFLFVPLSASAVFPVDEKSGRPVLPESAPVIRRVEPKRRTVPRRITPPSPPREVEAAVGGLSGKLLVGSLLLLLLVSGYFHFSRRREATATPPAGKPQE